MSTTTGDNHGALIDDQSRFIADMLGANARWSASIHTAALDGQERTSNEWAARYLRLVERLEDIVSFTRDYERDTELYKLMSGVVAQQDFYPGHASQQIERYRAALEQRKVEQGAIDDTCRTSALTEPKAS